MTVSIGDIVRGVLSYTSPTGSIAQNVFFYELQDATADEQDVIDDLETGLAGAWIPYWQDLSDNSCVCIVLEADIVDGEGKVTKNLGQNLIGTAGSGVGEIMPAAVSGYIHHETERPGSLARKYVPFIAEGVIDDGLFDAGGLADLVLLLAFLTSDVGVTGGALLVPGILSRVTQSFQEMLGNGYTTDVPAYQRRRKPYVGS